MHAAACKIRAVILFFPLISSNTTFFILVVFVGVTLDLVELLSSC